ITQGKTYKVTAIKPSRKADLCLVRIKENLHIEVVVAAVPAPEGEPLIMGGHPLGLPMIVQRGYASEMLNVGTALKSEWVMLTSMFVQPGHSGSGVFNSSGELVGVMEMFHYHLKTDSMGFGMAVPQHVIVRFLSK